MTSTTAGTEEAVPRTLDSLRQMIDAEIARTTAERNAFDSFRTELSGLSGLSQRPQARAAGVGGARSEGEVRMRTRTGNGLVATDTVAAIRTAYEETVMDVDFHESEYGESYPESLREEFGEDIAIALTRPECFTPAVGSSLFEKVDAALTERERLLDVCHDERESLDRTSDDLIPVAEESGSIATMMFDQQTYGELQYQRDRLLRSREDCETVVRRRQATLNSRRERYELADGDPDFCSYIYRESETSYPLLSLCGTLVSRIEATQGDVERALASFG